MNSKLFALTAVSLLALTACSGGGSADSPSTSPITVNPPTGQNSLTNKYANIVSGRVIIEHSDWIDDQTGWEIYDYETTDLAAADTQKKDLNSFKITSGKTTYVIHMPKQGDKDFKQYGNFVVNVVDMGNNAEVANTWGTNLSYARYGLAYGDTDHTQDPNAKYSVFYGMFHQGYLTDPAGMPTAGTVNYKGEAIVWNGQPNIDETGISKNATFVADFSKKQFTGKISNINVIEPDQYSKVTTIPDISLAGTIVGNKVTGKNAEGTVIDAGFYGPNAAEVAGSFVNQEKVFEGAFGAKKVNQ